MSDVWPCIFGGIVSFLFLVALVGIVIIVFLGDDSVA